MDIKPMLLKRLGELNGVCNDYTFTEILFTIMNKLKPKGESVKWILELDDNDIYTSLEKSIKKEKEIREE